MTKKYDVNIQKVLIDAYSYKRPSKSKIYTTLIDAVKAREIPLELAINLLGFFQPSRPEKAKTKNEWIWKAVADEEIRFYLNFAHSDGKHMFGADGHRMHWVSTDKPEGFYDPVSYEPVTLDAKFPDVHKVIPKLTKKSKWVDFVYDPANVAYSVYNLDGPVDYKLPNGAIINNRYLLEALNGEDKVVTMLDGQEKHKAQWFRILAFDGTELNALIMPLRDDQ